jgi:energy-coupling factor transporter ATP-binding protein EcfA2
VNILRGKTFPPARIVVYGPSGVGKSTFACAAPGVLALDYEHGLHEIGPSRVLGAATWTESLALVREACEGSGDWTQVTIDTLDKLFDQCAAEVVKGGKKGEKTLSDFGWGDGFEAAAGRWRELLFILEGARAKGRSVVLVAHVQQQTSDDPQTGGKTVKSIAAIDKRSWGATHRWADAILFADYERGLSDKRVVMTGERILHTQAGTGFDAKNRWGLPKEMPLSWTEFERARQALCRTPDEVRKSILSLVTPETAAKAEEFTRTAGDDVVRLVSVENALRKKVGT